MEKRRNEKIREQEKNLKSHKRKKKKQRKIRGK